MTLYTIYDLNLKIRRITKPIKDYIPLFLIIYIVCIWSWYLYLNFGNVFTGESLFFSTSINCVLCNLEDTLCLLIICLFLADTSCKLFPEKENSKFLSPYGSLVLLSLLLVLLSFFQKPITEWCLLGSGNPESENRVKNRVTDYDFIKPS